MNKTKKEVLEDLSNLSNEQLFELVDAQNHFSFAEDSFVRKFLQEHFGTIQFLPMQLQELYPILSEFLYNKLNKKVICQ